VEVTRWKVCFREDHLLERKTERSLKDLRRTAVAFANSVRPDHTATILIGESNDGSVLGVTNPDRLQRDVRSELDEIYPPIEWRQVVYEKEGKSCIRIEIEYSGKTPHFGSSSWIRKGSETVKASDEMLQRLIEFRSSKVRELNLWLNKTVTVSWSMVSAYAPVELVNWGNFTCDIARVNQFFVTFARHGESRNRSEPIQWLDLSWDDGNNRLRIYVNPKMSPMFNR
jgi:hypothetical protein